MKSLVRVALAMGLVLTAAACTGGSDGGDPLDHLEVSPDGATIDTGTSIRVRATGVTKSGRHVEVEGVTWTASAGSVDGSSNFSSTAAGDATLTAMAEGVEGTATIHVVAPGSATVQVVDATTGTGIDGAFVNVVLASGSAGTSAVTTGGGNATLSGASVAGELDIHVRATNYHPVTVYGAKVKSLRIPMRPVTAAAAGSFSGVIDFETAYDRDAPPSDPPSLWIGFAGSAIKGNILSFGFDGLLGPNRPVDLGGLQFEAPSNVFIYGATEDYVAGSPAGATAAWALGVEVELQEVLDIAGNAGSSDIGTILREAIPIFERAFHVVRTGLTITANQELQNQDLVLDTKIAKTASLSVPPRPVNDPNPIMIAAAQLENDLGLVPVGLGLVDGENTLEASMKVRPLTGELEGSSYVFVTVSQEGGTGAGSADQQLAVLARGVTDIGSVEQPEFFVPPAYTSFTSNASTRTFSYAATAGADLVFSTFSYASAATNDDVVFQWDVIAPGDSTGFVLPMTTGTSGATAGGSWTVQTLGLESETYDGIFVPGAKVDASTYFDDANRIVLTNADVD